jgi:hypothetical protein
VQGAHQDQQIQPTQLTDLNKSDQLAKLELSSPTSSQWPANTTAQTSLTFQIPTSFNEQISITNSPTNMIQQNISFTVIRSLSSNQSAESLSVSSETEKENEVTPSRVSLVSNSLVNLFESIKLT